MFIHFLLCRLTLKSRCPLCPQLFCKILCCDTVWYASTISHILYSVNAYFANCILEISRVCMSICRSYMYIYKYIMIYNYTFMYRQVALSDSPLEAASMLLSSLFLFITKMWKPENCRIWSWHLHTSYVMEGDVARLWLLRSVVNAPQNWLIEEFYMVRCERQCMNLEENQSAKFIKVVTAAEHTRCTLLHCLFWILVVFLTCLALYLYRSWALLESSICIRGFRQMASKVDETIQSNNNCVYLTAAKGSLPERWQRIDYKVLRLYRFISFSCRIIDWEWKRSEAFNFSQ